MIKKIKHIIGLCTVTSLLALSFISCSQATTPETPAKTADQIKLEKVVTDLTLSEKIFKSQTQIDLPTEIDGVTIKWTSSDASVINVESKEVTHAEEDKTVTLTAKLSLKELKSEKKFTVIVVGTTTQLTDEEIITDVLEGNSLKYDPVFSSNNFQVTKSLPNKIDNVDLTWAPVEDNSNVVLKENNTKVSITQDLVDYVAKLKVTGKFNGKSKDKILEIKIPRIEKIEISETIEGITKNQTITITDSTITDECTFSMDSDVLVVQGGVYEYTYDAKTKTLNITTTHMYLPIFQNEQKTFELKSMQEIYKLISEEPLVMGMKQLKMLAKTPTRENLIKYVKATDESGNTTDDYFQNMALAIIGSNLTSAIEAVSYNEKHEAEFDSVKLGEIESYCKTNPEEETAAIVKFVSTHKTSLANGFGLDPKTASYDDLTNIVYQMMLQTYIAQYNLQIFSNDIIDYNVELNTVSFNFIFNKNVPLLKQLEQGCTYSDDNWRLEQNEGMIFELINILDPNKKNIYFSFKENGTDFICDTDTNIVELHNKTGSISMLETGEVIVHFPKAYDQGLVGFNPDLKLKFVGVKLFTHEFNLA